MWPHWPFGSRLGDQINHSSGPGFGSVLQRVLLHNRVASPRSQRPRLTAARRGPPGVPGGGPGSEVDGHRIRQGPVTVENETFDALCYSNHGRYPPFGFDYGHYSCSSMVLNTDPCPIHKWFFYSAISSGCPFPGTDIWTRVSLPGRVCPAPRPCRKSKSKTIASRPGL